MRTPHQNLTQSSPELKDSFHELKVNDKNFHALLMEFESLDEKLMEFDDKEEYHEVSGIGEMELEDLKKRRVLLKDQLYNLMLKHKQSTMK